MGNIFKDLAIKYHTGSLLIKLIFINIAVFLIVRLTGVVLTLSGTDINPLLSYLQLPSNLSILAWRPWTLVSYMFLQYDLLHILFNMLWLYWFGQLFLHFFSEKQMGGLYILGGLSGAGSYWVLRLQFWPLSLQQPFMLPTSKYHCFFSEQFH